MGELRPSIVESKHELASQKLVPKIHALADIYLAKDSGRTEQLNTANAIIAAGLLNLTIPKPDINSLDSCQEAVIRYFENCAEKNVRPALSGICVALGVTRQQFIQTCETGQVTFRDSNSAIALPNDVWKFFIDLRSNYAAMIESFLETNMIHPTAGIFLLKNNCGYQDEITHHYDVTKTTVDLTALAEKYSKELEE